MDFAGLGLALILGYFISGASMLYVEYSFASTADAGQETPINRFAVESAPKNLLLAPTATYQSGRLPAENHSRWFHFGLGASITTALSFMRHWLPNWPLHPVGYLLCYSYPMQRIWFSIFVGWLAKVLTLRFGGASLFSAARPLFLGLILGEAGAAGFWLIVSLVRNSLGLSYHAVNQLPT